MNGIKNVLIVDDSKTSRTQLGKLLDAYRLDIEMAESAEDALEMLRKTTPDAIFLDHTMPGMDGLQMLAKIKTEARTAAIPVAMYTAVESKDYAEQAQGIGAVTILRKPPTSQAVSDAMGMLYEASVSAVNPAASAESALAATGRFDALIAASAADQPAKQPPPVEFSEERIDALFSSRINHALRHRLMPLVDEHIAKLSQQLTRSSESTALAAAERAVRTGQIKLKLELEQQFDAKLLQHQENDNRQLNAIKTEVSDAVNQATKWQLVDLAKEVRETAAQAASASTAKIEKTLDNKLLQLVAQQQQRQKRLYWLSGGAVALAVLSLGLQLLQQGRLW